MQNRNPLFSRREFLWRAALSASGVTMLAVMAGCSGGGGSTGNVILPTGQSTPATPTTTAATPTTTLPTLPVRQSQNGVLDTTLNVVQANITVGGVTVSTRTYEGSFPGPVLRINQGDMLKVLINNQLPPNPDQDTSVVNSNGAHLLNTTNLHVHGLHVTPVSPGDNILVQIDPGSSFQYQYQLPTNHPDGNYWYHPHFHGSVAIQVMGGMGGPIIIDGPLDQVPEVAAAEEVILFFNQITLNPSDQIPANLCSICGVGPDALGEYYTVNGAVNPTLVIHQGQVQRWRIFNGTWETIMPLQLDGHDFTQLAMDGITFPQAVTTPSVFVPPAGRTDLLVQGGAPGTYTLRKLSYSQESGGPRAEVEMLTVVVLPAIGAPGSLPTTLPAPAVLNAAALLALSEPGGPSPALAQTRTLTFEEGTAACGTPCTFPIAGSQTCETAPLLFDETRIDQTMTLGTAEEWTLLNNSPDDHVFHIHINPYLVTAINGQPLATPVWNDTTVIPKQTNGVPGSFTMRTSFVDFTGVYVAHCHILDHEDSGMMELVQVVN